MSNPNGQADQLREATQTPEQTPGRRRRFSVDALFADHRPQAVGVTDLPTAKEILLDRIQPDPDQPRRTFDPEKLEELAASIRIEGILQPIVVRYDTLHDTYVVVHGERRWRAARLAGLDRLPAIVRDVPPDRRLIQQLMENIVRDDLNAVDRAAALRGLKTQLGDAPWDQVAEAVGIRRSRLFQLLGTEKLPETAQDDIRAGRLGEKQSRALQSLPLGAQEALRAAIVADNLSADDAMRLARDLRSLARPDDDPDDAATILARLRAEGTQSTQAPDSGDQTHPDARMAPADPHEETAILLAALAAAAGGGRAERQRLARAAAAAPPYEPERLRVEILALARTLARAPATDLRPGGPAYGSLTALWGALDAVLSQR